MLETIMTDLVFLVALLLVAWKMVITWRKLFPKGFDVWLAERKENQSDQG